MADADAGHNELVERTSVTSARLDAASTTPTESYAAVYETHTGLVVLVADLAYKTKKPVVTDFLDFSTPELREQACQRELQLNRRLAPASYLGVAHLCSPWSGGAEPVLVMRRHPDTSRLATVVQRSQPVDGALLAVAEMLAGFHHTASRGAVIDEQGTVEAVRARWAENLAELQRFTGTVIASDRLQIVRYLSQQFLDGRAALMAERISAGRIVDGHGDLLAEDIFCLPEGPRILDCLEFDDDLRYVDVIDDAAFLAMDLEYLGRQDLGECFLRNYRRLTGDRAPRSLEHFYIAYRAVVRAKVDCVRFSQGVLCAAADASHHLDIAVQHLRSATVRLALIGGGPGTGKTTLARALADLVGAVLISSDNVRRELQRAQIISGTVGVLNSGLYSEDNIAAVYREVLRRARVQLATGNSVILDGTWRNPKFRDQARRIAAETHSTTVEFQCITTTRTAAQRVRKRPPGATSDATPEIARALSADHSGWPESNLLDTSRPVSVSLRAAEGLWRGTS